MSWLSHCYYASVTWCAGWKKLLKTSVFMLFNTQCYFLYFCVMPNYLKVYKKPKSTVAVVKCLVTFKFITKWKLGLKQKIICLLWWVSLLQNNSSFFNIIESEEREYRWIENISLKSTSPSVSGDGTVEPHSQFNPQQSDLLLRGINPEGLKVQ